VLPSRFMISPPVEFLDRVSKINHMEVRDSILSQPRPPSAIEVDPILCGRNEPRNRQPRFFPVRASIKGGSEHGHLYVSQGPRESTSNRAKCAICALDGEATILLPATAVEPSVYFSNPDNQCSTLSAN
jgi:hypothetical protein